MGEAIVFRHHPPPFPNTSHHAVGFLIFMEIFLRLGFCLQEHKSLKPTMDNFRYQNFCSVGLIRKSAGYFRDKQKNICFPVCSQLNQFLYLLLYSFWNTVIPFIRQKRPKANRVSLRTGVTPSSAEVCGGDYSSSDLYSDETREMENISRGTTFGDFVTIRTEESIQDVPVARLQSTEYRLISPPSFRCIVLRESLSVDSQNIPCATLKRRWSWVFSVYLWMRPSISPALAGAAQLWAAGNSSCWYIRIQTTDLSQIMHDKRGKNSSRPIFGAVCASWLSPHGHHKSQIRKFFGPSGVANLQISYVCQFSNPKI
jgi:hypothetical protein